jgi:NAD(P)-dependent dehydrogenase (short-subunit alcohol dehydrogenase family)
VQELVGRVAVVTGSASGLGRAMAERFGSEGMTVVIADNRLGDAEIVAGEIAAPARRWRGLPRSRDAELYGVQTRGRRSF